MSDTEFGRIVFLNGSSSAGKTTLAQALQRQRMEPWFHLALDQFRDGMPERYRGMNAWDGTPGSAGLNVVPVQRGDARVTEVRFGAVGHRMLAGMRRAIAAFATAGNNVIIDDLLLEPGMVEDYALALAGHWVLLVGVRCDLETVNAREGRRWGRFPGTATSHFEQVHSHGLYDVEVDTARLSPDECAARIGSWLDGSRDPEALTTLRRRFLQDD